MRFIITNCNKTVFLLQMCLLSYAKIQNYSLPMNDLIYNYSLVLNDLLIIGSMDSYREACERFGD